MLKKLPILLALVAIGCSSPDPALLEVQALFPCNSVANDTEDFSLTASLPESSSSNCECVQKAMSADMKRPEFSVETEKLTKALTRLANVEPEKLKETGFQRTIKLGSLVNMERKLYRDNAPSANEGLEAATNVSTTTLREQCDLSYSDLRISGGL